MQSWAFATSPHGLALPEARSWELTPREFNALTNVFIDRKLKPWAAGRADFHNAYFWKRGEVAYMAEDFLGTGDRKKRALEEAKSQMAAMKANTALAKIRRDGPPPPEVPAWAIGEYRQGLLNA